MAGDSPARVCVYVFMSVTISKNIFEQCQITFNNAIYAPWIKFLIKIMDFSRDVKNTFQSMPNIISMIYNIERWAQLKGMVQYDNLIQSMTFTVRMWWLSAVTIEHSSSNENPRILSIL